MNNKITILSRILIFITSISIVISIFVPIWRIELDAPQYPEGLMMTIHANKLGGEVDIINGLNHYIGMGTLHAENFIEFTILPYIIGFYALLMLLTSIVGRKKMLYFTFWLFILFGIVAMADFWRWEYNYGHNLDPKAAIIVPGMSYQPPLIGFKQLLNFGAYSIPDIGGWLFVLGGILLLICVLIETKILNQLFKKKVKNNLLMLAISTVVFLSCNNKNAQPIKLNIDKCDFCEMSISDGRFGTELITEKGRAYKFDDMHCLKGFERENSKVKITAYYVHDYDKKNELIEAKQAFYILNEEVKSPMGGNIAAFANKDKAIEFGKKYNSEVLSWNDINN